MEAHPSDRIGRHLSLAVLFLTAAIALLPRSASAQVLPWEMTVAEIEAGRLRGLAERLAKQNLLFQLRLADVRKTDLVETSERIDRVIGTLERGSPSYSVPAPWTAELREQLRKVDAAWGPLRRMASATSFDVYRVSREFVPNDSRKGDPLLLRYFDNLTETLVTESEELLRIYHEECLKTELGVCATARASGYAAMVIERAAREAVYIFADIDAKENRKSLEKTIAAYKELRKANLESPFYAAALDPTRGPSAKAAGELLASLRNDWDAMQKQFALLADGDLEVFDLSQMLNIHSHLVDKVERMTAALVRYASLAYGA